MELSWVLFSLDHIVNFFSVPSVCLNFKGIVIFTNISSDVYQQSLLFLVMFTINIGENHYAATDITTYFYCEGFDLAFCIKWALALQQISVFSMNSKC